MRRKHRMIMATLAITDSLQFDAAVVHLDHMCARGAGLYPRLLADATSQPASNPSLASCAHSDFSCVYHASCAIAGMNLAACGSWKPCFAACSNAPAAQTAPRGARQQEGRRWRWWAT